MDPASSPRISFSLQLLDENEFISINPGMESATAEKGEAIKGFNTEFEFLSSEPTQRIIHADELFFDGKLLPFSKMQFSEKIDLPGNQGGDGTVDEAGEDDPSPRPPKCTVLWKELLRLKKNRPPPSTHCSPCGDGKEENKDKLMKLLKKNLERAASLGSARIKPVISLPICTHGKPVTPGVQHLFFPKK